MKYSIISIFISVYFSQIYAQEVRMYTYSIFQKDSYVCQGKISGKKTDKAYLTFYPEENVYVDELRSMDVLNDRARSMKIKTLVDFQFLPSFAFSTVSIDFTYSALPITFSGTLIPYGFVYPMEGQVDDENQEELNLSASQVVENSLKIAYEIFDEFHPFVIKLSALSKPMKISLISQAKGEFGNFTCEKEVPSSNLK